MDNEQEQPNGIAVAFIFEGQEDRNFKLQWPGQLPRKGDMVKLRGRDMKFRILDLAWVLGVDRAGGRLDRAVVVHLKEEA